MPISLRVIRRWVSQSIRIVAAYENPALLDLTVTGISRNSVPVGDMTSTRLKSTLPHQGVVSLVEDVMTDRVDAGWSVREFESLDLGDARLNRRLLLMAEAFGAHPQAPI